MTIQAVMRDEDRTSHIDEFLQVKNWMTPNPHCIRSGQTLNEAGEMIERLKVDGLPVVDDNERLVGMVTLKKLFSYFLRGNQGE
ncbi:MAG TPA: CBS domain-containing protein, partial [Chondromyces sp.]|nr:CBS domain-containing protein [Chondromyces sp.]